MKIDELSKNEFKLFEQFKMFIESSINPWDNASSLHLALTEAEVEYAFIGGIAVKTSQL